jgi:hypothetical protein
MVRPGGARYPLAWTGLPPRGAGDCRTARPPSWSERPSRATGGRGKGRQPTLDELAERVGIDRDRAEELLRANARMRSLSEPATGCDLSPGRPRGSPPTFL